MKNNNFKFMRILAFILVFISVFAICLSPQEAHADEIGPTTKFSSWYSFNSVIDSQYQDFGIFVSGQSSIPVTFNPYGEGDVTTNTINYIQYINREHVIIQYSFRFYDRYLNVYENYDIEVYRDGVWVDENYRYIFISGDIDDNLYDFLSDNGVWAFTQPLQQSTMTDVIFALADIPPRIIQNLTSFEILGFSLFAVFGLFVAVIIVVHLIRGAS